jgi:hypothetical protein
MARTSKIEDGHIYPNGMIDRGPGPVARHRLAECPTCHAVEQRWTSNLVRNSANCSSCRKFSTGRPVENHIGEVINCLRCAKHIGTKDGKTGVHEWLCVCGGTVELQYRDVKSGKQKTCGDKDCTASLRADKDWLGDLCPAAKKWHALRGRPDYFIDTGKELAPGVKYHNPETFGSYDAAGYEVRIKGQRILVNGLPVRTKMESSKMRDWHYQLDPASPTEAPVYVKDGSRWAFMGMRHMRDDRNNGAFMPWCIEIGRVAVAAPPQGEKAANTDRDGYSGLHHLRRQQSLPPFRGSNSQSIRPEHARLFNRARRDEG